MIYAAVTAIEEDVNQLRSLMSQLGEVWDDKVSAYVSDTLITAVISSCNAFANEASSMALSVIRDEETLDNLLAG